ncbi:MAG TPA: acetate--CoA ligase [Methanospirillum sp.]|uniref:acetate--CoA ligase n=1 Tax=Methanospirillum sp. TaxID=45200 RepID=UPI001BD47B1C|nr:acetate--CoA ligase [Methanospirillum sp.]HPY59128.1 acetate--CoA ligase [Methanospirillum sp.]
MTEEKPYKPDPIVHYPDPSFKESALIHDYNELYHEFEKDPDAFWRRIASDLLWFKQWDNIKVWNHPYAQWFTGADLNITYNCLERHINNDRRNKVAIFWAGENGKERILTYYQLYKDVMRLGNALKSLGVKKGDRVCIYLPGIPELVVSMLACARIGAVHTVVFAGYGSKALNERITGAGAKIVITADASVRRGGSIPLKPVVEEALIHAPTVERVIILRTQVPKVSLLDEFELDYEELIARADRYCEPTHIDSEDPLFILYTSGTTGPPKGIVHAAGGYMVGAYYTTKYVLTLRENDVYWCTADPGWITGHTYGIYGPLLVGGTIFLSEYTPDYPDPGIWWKLIEDYGITIFYTAPTAIRMFMRMGEEWPDKYDLSTLRLLGSVGEPLNPEAFEWFYKYIGKDKCPILDTWWQTETGMHMITTMVGLPMKPGYAGKPIPGVIATVVDDEGDPVPTGTTGYLAIKEPWPSMMKTVYQNDERYRHYWNFGKYGYYSTNDLAVMDEDGYIMFLGRSDDIIIVAGHNVGTAEIESALVSHSAVAEAAAIGKPDPLKGNIIKVFVILRNGVIPTQKLVHDLKYHVRIILGPISVPAELDFVDSLPKTRSGKIMRRVLKAKEMGLDPGDISTLDE